MYEENLKNYADLIVKLKLAHSNKDEPEGNSKTFESELDKHLKELSKSLKDLSGNEKSFGENDEKEEEDDEDEEGEQPEFSNPAEAARHFINKEPNMKATCCWDWVKKIYDASGFAIGQSWQDLNYVGKDAGTHRASSSRLQGLQPGDWLYINNRNNLDTHGNHSVIFLGWKSPLAVAEVASYYNNSSHIHSYNINEYPVTHITKFVKKPEEAKKSDLNKKSSKNINSLVRLANIFKYLTKML